MILGAHIDFPNSPGAFDDGSGSASLLEVARVLDVSQIQPSVDVYLAWFGGHEIGTYGSAHFVSTHQELLDRSLGMLVMDGLGHPLDERTSHITLMTTSYGLFGDDRLLLPDFLSKAVASQSLTLDTLVEYGLIADNSNFDAFNVPNVFLGYINGNEWKSKGSSYIHYSNHFHDPYETVDLASEVGEAFVGMTKVMLSAHAGNRPQPTQSAGYPRRNSTGSFRFQPHGSVQCPNLHAARTGHGSRLGRF